MTFDVCKLSGARIARPVTTAVCLAVTTILQPAPQADCKPQNRKPAPILQSTQVSNAQLIGSYFRFKLRAYHPTVTVDSLLGGQYIVSIHTTVATVADKQPLLKLGEQLRKEANTILHKQDRSQPTAIPDQAGLVWNILVAQAIASPTPATPTAAPPAMPDAGSSGGSMPASATITLAQPQQDPQTINAQQIANLFEKALSKYKAMATVKPIFGGQFAVSITATVTSDSDKQSLITLATTTVAAVNAIQANVIASTGLDTSGITVASTDPHQTIASSLTNQITTMLADSRITVKVEPRPNNTYAVSLSGVLESKKERDAKIKIADADIKDVVKNLNAAQVSAQPPSAPQFPPPPKPRIQTLSLLDKGNENLVVDLTWDPTLRITALFAVAIGNPAITVTPQPMNTDRTEYRVVVAGSVANREAVDAIRKAALAERDAVGKDTGMTIKLNFTNLFVSDVVVKDVWHIVSLGTQLPADVTATVSPVQGVVAAINSVFGTPPPAATASTGASAAPSSSAAAAPAAGAAAGTPAPTTTPGATPTTSPAAGGGSPASATQATGAGTAGAQTPLAVSDGNNIWLSGPRSKVEAAKAFLALVDSPLPQVQMDTWAIQVSGNSREVDEKTEYVDEQIQFAQKRMANIQKLLLQVLASHSTEIQNDEIAKVVLHYFLNPQDERNAPNTNPLEFPFSSNEALILLGISPNADAMVRELKEKLREDERQVLDDIEARHKKLEERLHGGVEPAPDQLEYELNRTKTEIEMIHAEMASEIFQNLTEAWKATGIQSDRNGLALFLKRLKDYRAFVRALGVYDQAVRGKEVFEDGSYLEGGLSPSEELDRLEFAPEMLARISNEVNSMLEVLMNAFAKDMKEMYCEPVLTRIRRHFGTSTGANLAGKITFLVTSQQKASLSAQMVSYVNATRPAPFGQDLLNQVFPAPGTSAAPLSGLAAFLSPYSAGDRALLAAALSNDLPPVFAQTAPNITLVATPTITPDGSSADLNISATFGVATTEATIGARTDIWATQPPDAVTSHTVTTRTSVAGFKLIEISSLDIAETHPHPPFYIPILGRLPLIGPAFQFPVSPHTVQHRSILMTNVTIVPRVLGLVGFYGSSKAGFIRPFNSDVEQDTTAARPAPVSRTIDPSRRNTGDE